MTGNQMATIFEMISRDERARKTAMQTSQLPVMDELVCGSACEADPENDELSGLSGQSNLQRIPFRKI